MKMLLISAAAVLAAGAAAAQSSMPMGSSTMAMAPMTTPQFLTAAAQSDEFEITEGKMAQSMGASPKVKAIGAMMVRAHTKTTMDMHKAIMAAGMTPPPPPPLSAAQQAMVSQLQGLSGPAFDQAYVAQQITAHSQTLAAVKSYAKTGDKPAIRAAAMQTEPVVSAHLSSFKSLQAGMMKG